MSNATQLRQPRKTSLRAVPTGSSKAARRANVPQPQPAAIVPVQKETAAGNPSDLVPALLAYQVDFWQRSVLFLDTLRERGDNMLEHQRQNMPPLLDFEYELLLDARRFAHPANYALLRVTGAEGERHEDCEDPAKPPVVIIDPRAGHGPGIGGFKRDSEVGMALHQGHPVYFVAFFPEPMEGQTLADVLHAQHRFVEEVAARHPGKPPVLYGNCQAGWAVALMSADCEGLVGPAVLSGAPLSYWAGAPGRNPMRYSGGNLGGTWLASLTADLGNGIFDGAYLVENFENLDPEWRTGVLSMVATPHGAVEVGTRTVEQLRLAGKTWRNDGEVLAVDPGRSFRWRTTEGADAHGGRCVVRMELHVEPHGAERLMAPLLRRMLDRNLRGDLERLRALAQARAAQPDVRTGRAS